MKIFDKYLIELLSHNILTTIAIFIFILILRYLIFIKIQRLKKVDRQSKRLLQVNVNTISIIIISLVILFFWSHQIKNFGVSIVAISVAIVIAMKEIILCISASIYKSIARISKIGDRIEINGLRGDVLFSGMFSTTLLEIGPNDKSHQYTGRSIVIPNSYFLEHRTINESFLKDYVLHVFTIPISIYSNIEVAKSELFVITTEISSPYLELAKKHIDKLQDKRNVETPDPSPRVFVSFKNSTTIELIVRIAVPGKSKGEIEQKILNSFLSRRENWLCSN